MNLEMKPISPRYTAACYLRDIPFWMLLITVGVLLGFSINPWLHLIAVVSASFLLFELWVIPLQTRRMGWLETEDELLISKGKIWHTLTVIPYGRIQFVEVSAGPIDTLFGLKRVKLNTASSSSDSQLPGLTAANADALRARLSKKARERMSGL